jgi:hypothetical protein
MSRPISPNALPERGERAARRREAAKLRLGAVAAKGESGCLPYGSAMLRVAATMRPTTLQRVLGVAMKS